LHDFEIGGEIKSEVRHAAIFPDLKVTLFLLEASTSSAEQVLEEERRLRASGI
jgi:uncharacterized protein (DUF1778 family)